jgi:predicted esterase
MNEKHIEVKRTARYYTLGNEAAEEVWFVCHGYAQLARFFIRQFEPLADGSRLIVAPEALNRYYFETAPGVHAADARVGATWMTREARDLDIHDYIAYLETLYHAIVAERARVTCVALGFSQGAATVSRWAAQGQARLQHVVLWGGTIAHELAPRPGLLRGASLTIAIGEDDPAITEQRTSEEDRRLRDGGLEYRLYRYDGGHRIEDDALLALAAALRPTA